MKLYVCWGTFPVPWPRRHASWRPDAHPCKRAHDALVAAGHEPEVVKAGGCVRTDPIFPRRREVKRLTGDYKVPTLVLDNGRIVDGSQNIVDWARTLEAARLSE